MYKFFSNLDNKYDKVKEEEEMEKTKIEEIKDLKFPIQKVLKTNN